jgi:hypothetical protein
MESVRYLRIRRSVCLAILASEDDTCQIQEPKIENSGMPQGRVAMSAGHALHGRIDIKADRIWANFHAMHNKLETRHSLIVLIIHCLYLYLLFTINYLIYHALYLFVYLSLSIKLSIYLSICMSICLFSYLFNLYRQLRTRLATPLLCQDQVS